MIRNWIPAFAGMTDKKIPAVAGIFQNAFWSPIFISKKNKAKEKRYRGSQYKAKITERAESLYPCGITRQ